MFIKLTPSGNHHLNFEPKLADLQGTHYKKGSMTQVKARSPALPL
jgi:hypothetical protein